MTQHEEANRVRMSKRPVSMETRRFAGKYLKTIKKSTGFWMNINNIFEFLKIQSSKN